MKAWTTLVMVTLIGLTTQIANGESRKLRQPSSSQNKFYTNLCASRFAGPSENAECMGAINRLVKAHPELTAPSVALRVCSHRSDRVAVNEKNERDCLYKAKSDIELMQRPLATKISEQLKSCQKESMDTSKDSPCIKVAFQRTATLKKPISSSFQARN